MPSGGITITPGYQLGPGERVNNTKLNQGFQPVGQVNEGAITDREIDETSIGIALGIGGRNILINGDFRVNDYVQPFTGLTGTGQDHDYNINRWVMANDANRTANRLAFTPGQTEVPGSPEWGYTWQQTTALAVEPAYFGQRLPGVGLLSNTEVTFSIWVRSNVATSVTPQMRQFFGIGGGISPEVLLDGAAVTLAENVWQQVVYTVTVPSIAGKSFNEFFAFTEFRVLVAQALTFTMNFAQAQLEAGAKATKFDQRSLADELAEAARFYEVIGIMLVDNVSTKGKPFVNFRVTKRPTISGPVITLVPQSGTGATLAGPATPGTEGPGMVYQNTNHSAVVNAAIKVNAEVYDA
jgi:hypothetical protein